jgi:hypothetical protein
MKKEEHVSPIQFETKLIEINSWPIIHVPADASAKLPTRGMTMVKETISFQ